MEIEATMAQTTSASTGETTTSQQTNPMTTDTTVSQNAPESSSNDANATNIEKLIQSAVDRATNKLGNDNKKLREELNALKKEKMTADEIKQLELKDKEADIADRESKLRDKENRLYAIKAIKDAGLDDGGTNALELVDFVIGDDENVMKEKVKTLSALVKKLVAAEVNRTFKDHGRNPENGGAGSGKTENSIAAKLGKNTADRHATTAKVLNHYLGGNK